LLLGVGTLEVFLELMDESHHLLHLRHHLLINNFCVRRIATLRGEVR
jgi:hypothetical protein